MDPFITLREMWREARQRRALVALVLLIAVLTGLFVAYRPGLPPESRQYEVWLASADILVDTSDSQVVDAKGPDFLTLANRASLLGNLITTGPLKKAIAAAAAIPPDRLVVVPPANSAAPGVPSTPVTTVASRKIPDAEATVLTLSTDATLPILRVTAQAPDAVTAASLAGGTIEKLEQHLDSVAASEEIPEARKLVVRQLAAPSPAPETRGPPRLLGLATTIIVALLGCAAIVTAPLLARRWRQAEEAATEATAGNGRGRAAIEPEPRGARSRAPRRAPARGEAAELAGAVVAGGTDGMAEEPERPVPRKKQSRRRRKHGRVR